MSDKMRWRYSDTNQVVAKVLPETVIETGDLLCQVMTERPRVFHAIPVVDLPEPPNFAVGGVQAYQEELSRLFLGVAMQRSRTGDSHPIRVATTGVFEYPYDLEAVWLGMLVGVHVDPAAKRPSNQQVDLVTKLVRAIGRVAKYDKTEGEILVEIRSTIMTGGVVGRSPYEESASGAFEVV